MSPGKKPLCHNVSSLPGSRAPVYFYEFQHQSSFLKDMRPPHVKADHGDELPYVIGSFFWDMECKSSLFTFHEPQTALKEFPKE